MAALPEHSDRLFGSCNLGTPAGGVHVQLAELLIHLRGSQALRLERCRIGNDADGAVDAAFTRNRRDARYSTQLFRDGLSLTRPN